MNIYDLNELYDMLKKNGYIDEDDDKCDKVPNIDPSGGGKGNCCANVNLDIPGGFQDINPIVFITIGEVIGNIISGNVPFNMAVAISNWLNLIGQAIETYGAQQQYFQNGPGRYYHREYKNVSNPFCSCKSVSELTENNNLNEEVTSKSDIKETIKALQETLNICTKKINQLEMKFSQINNNHS